MRRGFQQVQFVSFLAGVILLSGCSSNLIGGNIFGDSSSPTPTPTATASPSAATRLILPPEAPPVFRSIALTNGTYLSGFSGSYWYDLDITSDGRYILFKTDELQAGDLLATGFTGNIIYRADTQTNQLTGVNFNDLGELGTHPSVGGITDDGLTAFFTAEANHLASVYASGYSGSLIYRSNLQTSTVDLTSGNLNSGLASAYMRREQMTPDGRYIVYNNNGIIYRKDNTLGTYTTVTRTADDSQDLFGAPAGSSLISVSSDGQKVLFLAEDPSLVDPSVASGNPQLVIANLSSGTRTLVSLTVSGEASDSIPWNAVMSRDGKRLFFSSSASNLIPSVGSGSANLYMKDLDTGYLSILNTNASGQLYDTADNYIRSTSDDGRFVCLTTSATNTLLPGTNNTNSYKTIVKDTVNGEAMLVDGDSSGVSISNNEYYNNCRLSGDGKYATFVSTNQNLALPDATKPMLWIKQIAR